MYEARTEPSPASEHPRRNKIGEWKEGSSKAEFKVSEVAIV
jgi:hypothetical protein